MNDAIEDTRLIEAANFTHTVNFTAHTVIASLRYLKELSHELGIPMADLQPTHVIKDLKRDDQKQRAHQMEAAKLDESIRSRCPTKAQQGARANAAIGHASCYRIQIEMKQPSENPHAARVAPARVVAHL